MTILGIDFGGTRIRAGWFTRDLQLHARDETLTLAHEPQENVIQRMIDTAKRVVPPGAKVDAIGISAPSPQAYTGYIRHATVLPTWRDVPLANLMSEAFGGVPTYMENDGNLAALAEYHMGAARGADPAIYLTISTSIGGGVVIDGKLFRGVDGLAFEPGHVKYLTPDGTVRSLEEMCAGRVLGPIAQKKLAAADTPSILRSVSVVDGKAVGQAAAQGDELALTVVREAGWWLGLGLLNVLHLFNPAVLVLGGSVTLLGDLILDPAKDVIRQYVIDPAYYHDDMIRLAQLGDDVGLVGAASYARDNFEAK